MDDLNLPSVPPAAARSEQPASRNSRPSGALAKVGSEPLASGGTSSHGFSSGGSAVGSRGSTSGLEPTPRRGEARRDWIVIAVCLVMLMAMGVWLFRAGPQNQDVARPDAKPLSREQVVSVGGIKRPITDVQRSLPSIPKGDAKSPEQDYGTFPLIPKDANVHVKSVAEAFRDGTHPERVSSMVLPKPFDAAAYKTNPAAYLDVVEPGRVWQPAQPGPNVPRIAAITARMFSVDQGVPTVIRVQSVPGAPVSFTAFDGGAFDNLLTSITVRADDKGVAKATFTGTTGVINDVNILAASPLTSGQIKYIANITLPKKTPLVSSTAK